MLVANYSGQVSGKAVSVKNQYLDEINSLNAYLGERQIFEESEEEVKDDSPSWYDGVADYWDSNDFLIVWNWKEARKSENFRIDWNEHSYTIGDIDTEQISSGFKAYLPIYHNQKKNYKDIFLNIGYGKGFEQAVDGYKIKTILNYNYLSSGLALGFMQKNSTILGLINHITVDVDYFYIFNKNFLIEFDNPSYFETSINLDIYILDLITIGLSLGFTKGGVFENYHLGFIF